jgi:hypothetical protein
MNETEQCAGPLLWFDVGYPPDSAVLECAVCGYLIATGSFNDIAHAETPVLRSVA